MSDVYLERNRNGMWFLENRTLDSSAGGDLCPVCEQDDLLYDDDAIADGPNTDEKPVTVVFCPHCSAICRG